MVLCLRNSGAAWPASSGLGSQILWSKVIQGHVIQGLACGWRVPCKVAPSHGLQVGARFWTILFYDVISKGLLESQREKIKGPKSKLSCPL